MIELLRRILLAGGLCVAAWMWTDSPRILVSAEPVDFAKLYARKYEPRNYAFFGAMEMGREVIRRTTNPGSAAAFRTKSLEGRSIKAPAGDWSAWTKEVDEALKGRGPSAGRVGKGKVFYREQDPVAQAFLPGLLGEYKKASWLAAYSVVAGRDYEFYYHPEPRESSAPQWILYPQRNQAWMWVLGALAAYLVVRRRSAQGEARHDPVPIAVMDIVGAVVVCLFFVLPLWIYDSNMEAVEDVLGGAGLSWVVAGLVLLGLFRNAALSAKGIRIWEGGLSLKGLMGERVIRFGEVAGVAPLEDSGERVGLELRLVSGEKIGLEWAGLVDFSSVLGHLRRAGYYRPEVGGS